MTGTDVARFTHKSVPVIFVPPCKNLFKAFQNGNMSLAKSLISCGRLLKILIAE